VALYWFISNLFSILQNRILKVWRKKAEKAKAEGKDKGKEKRKK
jgi:membrane protein insertase Oxa1/YidC/SpoIIIJ